MDKIYLVCRFRVTKKPMAVDGSCICADWTVPLVSHGTGRHRPTNEVSGKMVIVRLNYGWGTKMFTNCCKVTEPRGVNCDLKWMPGMAQLVG